MTAPERVELQAEGHRYVYRLVGDEPVPRAVRVVLGELTVELVEKVAQALYNRRWHTWGPWTALPERSRDAYRRDARAALSEAGLSPADQGSTE